MRWDYHSTTKVFSQEKEDSISSVWVDWNHHSRRRIDNGTSCWLTSVEMMSSFLLFFEGYKITGAKWKRDRVIALWTSNLTVTAINGLRSSEMRWRSVRWAQREICPGHSRTKVNLCYLGYQSWKQRRNGCRGKTRRVTNSNSSVSHHSWCKTQNNDKIGRLIFPQSIINHSYLQSKIWPEWTKAKIQS